MGKNGDRVTFARIEADRDSPSVFGLANNLRYGRILSRTFGVSGTQKFRRFPKALTQSTRPRPIPIEGESGLDNLAFFVEDESDTNIKLFSIDGTQISNITVPGKGSFAIGDYEPEIAGEEIAFQAGSKIRVLNPETEDVEERDDVSGDVVCEVNFNNTVAVTPTPTPTPEE